MTSNKRTSHEKMDKPAGRTFLLKVLIVCFLVLTWFGGVRVYAVFAEGNVLSLYLSQSEMIYIAAGGAIWCLAGLIVVITLWFGLSPAVWLSRFVSLGCFLWYWLDYLFMSQSSLSKTNWPFTLAATLLGLVMAWGIPVLPKEQKFLHRKSIQK